MTGQISGDQPEQRLWRKRFCDKALVVKFSSSKTAVMPCSLKVTMALAVHWPYARQLYIHLRAQWQNAGR